MSTQTHETDPFATEGAPSLSFKDAPIGTSYTGRVIEAATLVQSRDFESGAPAFWPDGNPKMSAVFKADFGPELGERSVWAPKPSALFAAIRDAQDKAGSRLAPGGTVTITYSGDGVRKDGNTRLNPPKQYAVTYTPPDAFAEAPAVPAQAAPVQPVAQVQGGQANPFAGLTPEQIAALAALQTVQQGQQQAPPF